MQEPQAWNLHLGLDNWKGHQENQRGEKYLLLLTGRDTSAVAGQSYRNKAADQEKTEIFIHTSRGKGYLIGGAAAFSDEWE